MADKKVVRSQKARANAATAEYLKLSFYSLGVAILNMFLFKFFDGWDMPAPWIAVSFLFEILFAFGLFALQRSIYTVLWVQFLAGLLLRTVNAAKIRLLGTPLLPSDLFLVEEVYRVMPGVYFWPALLAIVIPVLIAVYMLIRGLSRPTWKKAFMAAPAILISIVVVGFSEKYTDTFDRILEDELYGIPFLMKERQHALGVPLSFSLDLARFLAVSDHDPSYDEVASALDRLSGNRPAEDTPRTPAAQKKPRNLYIFMIESFWDPSWLLGFPDGLDPDFLQLWKANGGLNLLSPMLGGGTANVEFEVLCGIPSRPVTKGIIFQVALANEVPCLPKVLANQGYRSFAFHAFESGYFNRNAAFPSLGFEKFEGVEDFLNDAEDGVFVADEDFYKEALARLREYSGGQPFMAYFMTFAGHWPYAWLPEIYTREVEIRDSATDEKMNMLERHLNINRLSSKVIVKVIRDLQLQDPDALIVVAGDHMPSLGLAGKDPDANDWRFYHTPLFIYDRFADNRGMGSYVPAYALTSEILSRMGLNEQQQGFIARLRAPAGFAIRPEQNNATFVAPTGSSQFEICTPQMKTGPCVRAIEWLRDVRIIARDLVVGEQHTLEILK